MKTVLALVAASLVALAMAPSAQAAEVAAPDADFPLCQPAAVGTVCFSPYWPGCNVWVEWTAIPAQDTCLYRSDPLAASASGPDVQCMDVYSRTDAHTVSVVRRNSCAPPEAYQCPYPGAPIASCDPLLQAQAAAAAPLPPAVAPPPVHCMPYERELAVSDDVQVVQGGCGSYVRVCGDRVTPDWDADLGCLADDLLATSAAPPAECLPVYRETEVGPVRIVSRDSCHADATVCDRDLQTLTDPMQTDDAWQRRCVDETLDRYIAFG